MNSSSNSENYSIDRTSIEEETPNYANSIEYSARCEKIELDARKKYYLHRWIWSWGILIWITWLLIFDSFLTYKIGSHQWSFVEYPKLAHTIILSNFGQLAGMAIIVVKFLFNPLLQYINQSKESSGKTSAELLLGNN